MHACAQVLDPLVEIALIGENPGLVHRAAVALRNLLDAAIEDIVGPPGGVVPAHAVLALGALSGLAANQAVAPAQKAAAEAIADLEKARPDVKLPPPELVAEAVAKLRAEHEARVAAAEAEEEAAREAEALAEEEAKAVKEAREATALARKQAAEEAKIAPVDTSLPTVEEIDDDDDDDDDDDALEVI